MSTSTVTVGAYIANTLGNLQRAFGVQLTPDQHRAVHDNIGNPIMGDNPSQRKNSKTRIKNRMMWWFRKVFPGPVKPPIGAIVTLEPRTKPAPPTSERPLKRRRVAVPMCSEASAQTVQYMTRDQSRDMLRRLYTTRPELRNEKTVAHGTIVPVFSHPDRKHVTMPILVRNSPMLPCVPGVEDILNHVPLPDGEWKRVKELHRQANDSFGTSSTGETFSIVDLPLPKQWQTNGWDTEVLFTTCLITFGQHYTERHFEECACGMYAQLVQGTKVWFFWPPGAKPRKNIPHLYLVVQEKGDVVWVPGGWWHSVYTISDGAVLVGALFPGTFNNGVLVMSSMHGVNEVVRFAKMHDIDTNGRTKNGVMGELFAKQQKN